MKVKEIRQITDRDTKILLREYIGGKWIKKGEETPQMEEMEVKSMYAKCHKCGNPGVMRSQFVLMI